jgi:predicted nucleotidyltransferase
MINTKTELLQLLKSNANTIKSFGVEKLGLFGSFRHDNANSKSDVDFLVDFVPEKKTYDNLFNLYEFLQEKTGRRVEVLTRQGLSKYIGPHILKDLENVAL